MGKVTDIDFADPVIQRVARAKCLRSIAFHTKYFFWHQYRTKFILGEHHELICEALEDVLRGRCKRLIINLAPRYGKTELAVKSFISHGLALNPAAKFIHLSYGDAIALDNSEAIKDLIESSEYQTLFPGVTIKRDSKAKEKWYTNFGGGVLARAAAGQVTGFGAGKVDEEEEEEDEDLATFVDELDKAEDLLGSLSPLEEKMKFNGAIIIDDPIKPEDADQDTIREKVNHRFDSTIRNRVNSRNTPIIIIMQRLHPNDLAGYLQREDEADEWRILQLPCLIHDKEAEPVEVEQANGDKEMQQWRSLWPHKHTVEELLKLQKANELVFGRQYQQDPSPKSGLLFPMNELKFFNYEKMKNELADPDFTLVAADPANEGGDDFASGVSKLIGAEIFLTDIMYNTDGTDHNEAALENVIMHDGHRVSSVMVEGVFGWKETAARIRERISNSNKYGTRIYNNDFRIVRPRSNKHSRILNRASFIKNNMRFRDDWAKYPQYAKFMRNLIAYLRIQEAGKKNKHDDAPDLCEMKAGFYEKNFSHLW
jgi:hypothetical protein